VPLGSFLWGRRAVSTPLLWQPSDAGGAVAGEHDGYTRLSDPVICRRRLQLDAASRSLSIEDEIVAREAHDVEIVFHLSDRCAARQNGAAIDIALPEGTVKLCLDDRLQVSMVRGGTPREGGWVSSGYHRKSASWTVVGRVQAQGPLRLRTNIVFGQPAGA
jgi:hypothetical protein